VGREEDQSDPKIEIRLLGTVEEVSVEWSFHEGGRQRLEALSEVLLRAAHSRVRLSNAPDIFPDSLDVTAAHTISQPGREIHARHTTRRIVCPRETREVRVAESRGEAG
jgi:hypothetical protein